MGLSEEKKLFSNGLKKNYLVRIIRIVVFKKLEH